MLKLHDKCPFCSDVVSYHTRRLYPGGDKSQHVIEIVGKGVGGGGGKRAYLLHEKISYLAEGVTDEAQNGAGPQEQRELVSEEFFKELDPPAEKERIMCMSTEKSES